jgi:hypothetical protein
MDEVLYIFQVFILPADALLTVSAEFKGYFTVFVNPVHPNGAAGLALVQAEGKVRGGGK